MASYFTTFSECIAIPLLLLFPQTPPLSGELISQHLWVTLYMGKAKCGGWHGGTQQFPFESLSLGHREALEPFRSSLGSFQDLPTV